MTTTVTIEDARSFKADGKPPLYAARDRVYPKRVSGTFRKLKWVMLVVLLGIYYGTPWLRWERGPGAPDQAVLIDMPSRRAYFFFIEIWPHEVYYLTGLLILAAVGLFLVTSLMGRVWCAYACPQTVWTDLYMWVERAIEGDRNARIRLDKAPFGAAKALRKVAKHAVWLVIAAATGGAWILYFNDAPTVTREVFSGGASTTVYFFIGLFTLTTYTLAGWAREQLCTYMCPWPRFQAAMFDEHTMVVSYQGWRGEPRGKHHAGTSWEGRGHCVDCNLCIAVCPTGIDIRDGQQLECIGCALCIDACDSVMDKVGLPRGLIAFDTAARQGARSSTGKPGRYRLARPRTVLYGLLMVVVGGLMIENLVTRPTLDLGVQRDRNPLFVTLSDGSVRNGYTVKALNMSHRERSLRLSTGGLEEATLAVAGQQAVNGEAVLTVAPNAVGTFRVFVHTARNRLAGASTPMDFVVTDLETGEAGRYETVFRGPAP